MGPPRAALPPAVKVGPSPAPQGTPVQLSCGLGRLLWRQESPPLNLLPVSLHLAGKVL